MDPYQVLKTANVCFQCGVLKDITKLCPEFKYNFSIHDEAQPNMVPGSVLLLLNQAITHFVCMEVNMIGTNILELKREAKSIGYVGIIRGLGTPGQFGSFTF